MIENIRKYTGLMIVVLVLLFVGLIFLEDNVSNSVSGKPVMEVAGQAVSQKAFDRNALKVIGVANLLPQVPLSQKAKVAASKYLGDEVLEARFAAAGGQYGILNQMASALQRGDEDGSRFLANRIAIQNAGIEYGLTPSSDEVELFVENVLFSDADGNYDEESYREFIEERVGRLGLGTRGFNEYVRDLLTAQNLNNLLGSGLAPSEELVTKVFENENQRISAQQIKLSLEDFEKEIEPNEEEIKAYFEENQSEYNSEEKRKASYFVLAPNWDEVLEKVEAEEAEKKKAADEAAAKLEAERKKSEAMAKKLEEEEAAKAKPASPESTPASPTTPLEETGAPTSAPEVDPAPEKTPEISQSNTSTPAAGQPQAPEPDAPEPNAGQPQAPEPNAGQPQAPEPDAPEPNAGQPQAPEPDAPEPNAGQPEQSEGAQGEDGEEGEPAIAPASEPEVSQELPLPVPPVGEVAKPLLPVTPAEVQATDPKPLTEAPVEPEVVVEKPETTPAPPTVTEPAAEESIVTAKDKLTNAQKREAIEALNPKISSFFETVADQMGRNFREEAQNQGFEMKESALFTQADAPGIFAKVDQSQARSGSVAQAIFTLPENGADDERLVAPIQTEDGWFMGQLQEVVRSEPLTYEEAREQARLDLIKKLAREKMVARAEEIRNELAQKLEADASFEAAAKEMELKTTELKDLGKPDLSQIPFQYRAQFGQAPPTFTATRFTNPGEIADVKLLPNDDNADQALILFVEKREVDKTGTFQTQLDQRLDQSEGIDKYIALQNWLYDQFEANDVRVDPERVGRR